MSTTEFDVMHRVMAEYIHRMDIEGWPSPEVEECAKRVLRCLWTCAHNDPLPAPIAKLLAEETEKLAAAQAAAKKT